VSRSWDFATDFGAFDLSRHAWRAPLDQALVAADWASTPGDGGITAYRCDDPVARRCSALLAGHLLVVTFRRFQALTLPMAMTRAASAGSS
jgi:hypothetical protein